MNRSNALDKNIFDLDINSSSWVAKLSLIIGGTPLLWLSAKVQVPFYPVPQTLQSIVVVLVGIFLGPVLGGVTVFAYLVEGAVGLPVFAGTPEKGLGLAYMTGPTAGYLIGFLLAGYFAGAVIRKFPVQITSPLGFVLAAGVLLAALAIVYIPGVLWLSYLIGIEKAVQFGLMPFVLGDFAKGLLAAAIVCLYARLWHRNKHS